MSDQGIWFKLWCSSVDDPSLDNLPIADFGRWAKLGAYVKRHGTEGVLHLSAPCRTLCAAFQVETFAMLLECIQRLPHMVVTRNGDPETVATVTVSNWQRFQGDNSIERVRRYRARVTAKKRGEENRSSPPYPPPLTRGRSGRRKGQLPDAELTAAEREENEKAERILREVLPHGGR